MSELKKCPCCGYESVIETMQVRKGWEAEVHCNGCLLSLHSITFDTEEEAVTDAVSTWNRRAEPDMGITITEKMTCKGCIYFDDDHEFVPCHGCKRLVRVNDYYRQKQEGEYV